MKFYSLLLISLLFTFCKSSQKQSKELNKVVSAVWYNWSGGIAGVGGTNYEVRLSMEESSDIEVKSLILDEKEIKISSQTFEDGFWKITAIENRSNIDETVNPRNRKVNFRTENPNAAQITFLKDGKETTLQISNFTKGDSKNYQ